MIANREVGRVADRQVGYWRKLSWFGLGWALAGLGLFAVYRGYSVGPACVVRHYTGFYCPGCGMTRGLYQLLHGRIGLAIRYNPLIMLGAGLGVWLFLWQPGEALFGRRWPQPNWASWFWVVVAIFVGFGILRNLPGFPFELLRPPG